MRVLLRGGNLIDGLGNLLEVTDLLVEDGRIARIGNERQGAEGDPDEVLELAGKVVMPGLIDCHVHICKGNAAAEVPLWHPEAGVTEHEAGFLQASGGLRDLAAGVHHAQVTLAAGFTTVRDVGLALDYSDIVLREAIERRPDVFRGPRLLASGGGLTITGGHGWFFEGAVSGIVEVDGPDQARRVARRQLKAGADVLKVMATRAGGTRDASGAPEFSVEEMAAVCQEAHRLGKRVAAHAVGAEGIKNAVRAGVDTIEHGCLADEEGLELMAERGVYLVSTLYPYHRQAHIAVEHGYPDYMARSSLEIMEAYPNTLRKARDIGVKMALGSDCGIRGLTPHGHNATELEMVVELAGFSEMETIELATRAGAAALGLEGELGSLEPGKVADLIVVDGDPLRDIGVLNDRSRIAMVVKGGEVVVDP